MIPILSIAFLASLTLVLGVCAVVAMVRNGRFWDIDVIQWMFMFAMAAASFSLAFSIGMAFVRNQHDLSFSSAVGQLELYMFGAFIVFMLAAVLMLKEVSRLPNKANG